MCFDNKMSGFRQYSNTNPVHPSKLHAENALEAVEIYVKGAHDGSAGTSASDFRVRLPYDITAWWKAELIEVMVTGVPVSANQPDYPIFSVDLDGLSPNVISSEPTHHTLHVLLTGERTHHIYSPPRLLRYERGHTRTRDLHIKVNKEDGTQAESGVDLTGLYMVIRLFRDFRTPTGF